MKKLILILISLFFIAGCSKDINNTKFKFGYKGVSIRWLVEGEVASLYEYTSSSTAIIEFNNIYGKEYKIISYDGRSGIICVQKR